MRNRKLLISNHHALLSTDRCSVSLFIARTKSMVGLFDHHLRFRRANRDSQVVSTRGHSARGIPRIFSRRVGPRISCSVSLRRWAASPLAFPGNSENCCLPFKNKSPPLAPCKEFRESLPLLLVSGHPTRISVRAPCSLWNVGRLTSRMFAPVLVAKAGPTPAERFTRSSHGSRLLIARHLVPE